MRDKQTPRIAGKQLADEIASAQIRLRNKFVNLDATTLDISEYNQRYLVGKLASLKSVLALYGRLLRLSLRDAQVSLEDFVLVDYGGGSGLISLLAAELGIGTVIYNDIYDVSCTDARVLSDALGLRLDHVVCGDIDALVSYLRDHAIVVNAITSFDVLEHIYDVESHIAMLRCLPSAGLRIVYASCTNIENSRYVRSVKKAQLDVENNDREKQWGHKDRDSLRSYRNMRKDMISAYAPDLSQEVVDQLARWTRGLVRRDIEKCVDEFRQKGRVSYRIDHPTNTCDPSTGNWCEHLMNLRWLERVVRDQGFEVAMLAGRYDAGGSLPKNIAKAVINVVIRFLGRRGMFLAPYYVVYAKRAE
jgi:hypothetical protein